MGARRMAQMHPFLPSWYSEIDGVVLPKKFVFVFWVMD
jgi:hypothetical protein